MCAFVSVVRVACATDIHHDRDRPVDPTGIRPAWSVRAGSRRRCYSYCYRKARDVQTKNQIAQDTGQASHVPCAIIMTHVGRPALRCSALSVFRAPGSRRACSSSVPAPALHSARSPLASSTRPDSGTDDTRLAFVPHVECSRLCMCSCRVWAHLLLSVECVSFSSAARSTSSCAPSSCSRRSGTRACRPIRRGQTGSRTATPRPRADRAWQR